MSTLARDEDILKAAEDWRKAGRGVALATVVETWGSAPRPVGSNLIIDDQGNFLGSVSGGCVEGAVVTEALDVIEKGEPKTLEFGVADETASPAAAPSGSTWRRSSDGRGANSSEAHVKLAILSALNNERAARRAAIVVTDVANGAQRLVKRADVAGDPLKDVLEKHLRMGKSGMAESPQGRVFLTVHVPPPRLVVTGAVHISQALAPMAKLVGYDVTIVDPRTAFASSERFPDVKVIADWPDAALPPLAIDHYTAFVALTHDPKIDDPALTHALARDCFYIGALGSKKTHARRIERLKAQGISDAQLARIHSPIGLAIGAVSPAEIAVAIIGEITARLRLPAGTTS
jgi:xanthine dehydrogenase accessory factor